MVLPCTCISATDLRRDIRSIDPMIRTGLVHPDRRGSRDESTPVSRTIAFSTLLFFASSSSSENIFFLSLSLCLSSRFLAWRSEIVHPRRHFLAASRGRWKSEVERKAVEYGEEGGRKGWHGLKIEIIEVTSNTRTSRVPMRKHHRQLGSRGPFQPVFLANRRGMEGSNGGRSFQASV